MTYYDQNREHLVTVEVEAVQWHGRNAYGYGRLDGRPVTFVGEPRMLADIEAMIAAGEAPVPASVPTWALIGGNEA